MPILIASLSDLNEDELLVLAAVQAEIDLELRLSYVEDQAVEIRNSLIQPVLDLNPRVLAALKQSYSVDWKIAEYKDNRSNVWLSFSAL